MNNLVYLSFGQGSYNDELVYSVLSAQQMIVRERNNYRVIVYTDYPDAFSELPVHIEPLSNRVLSDWIGPSGYIYRRKICALRDALQKFGGRMVFCDTDTYFLKHPCKLFALVRPRHTVMHLREGRPDLLCHYDLAEFLENHDLRTIAGHRWNITRYTPVFNSGVIGLDAADVSLLDEVLFLIDQMFPRSKYFGTEQFAVGACFAQNTTLRQAYSIVNHYWPTVDRLSFSEKLGKVLHDPSISSDEDRLLRLSPYRPPNRINRPHESLKSRVRFVLSRAADRAGVKHELKRMANGLAGRTRKNIATPCDDGRHDRPIPFERR